MRVACYVLTQPEVHVWCVTIYEMAAINEITVKINHVLFTCNFFFRLRKRAHTCMLFQKSGFENFCKFQQLRWSLFAKSDISTTVEWALKKNSAKIVFLYCGINQFKTLNTSSIWKELFHSWVGRDFSLD